MYSPMEGDNWGETLYIEGQAPPPPDSDQNQASWVRVTDGYFDAIGTKIVEGRPITMGTQPPRSALPWSTRYLPRSFSRMKVRSGTILAIST